MPRHGNYILKGRKPVRIYDLLEFAVWFETANRVVAQTRIGNLFVSTVFLGIDHNYHLEGPPILFETMVFWSGETHREFPKDLYQARFATWSGAERHHKRLVKKLLAEVLTPHLQVTPGKLKTHFELFKN
jgi:hypothetical protein